MRAYIVALFLALFSVQQIYAASVPVSNMQNAVSGVIQAKMTKRGFAANDPRFWSTLQSAGAAIGGAVASAAVVTAAGITAPAWVTAGLAVGLTALFTAGINLAIGGIKWLLNSDGSVTTGSSSAQPAQLVAGGGYWSSYNFYQGIGSSPAAAVMAAAGDQFLSQGGTVVSCDINSNNTAATCSVWDGMSHYADGSKYLQTGSWNPTYNASGSPCTSSTGACRGSSPFTIPSAGSGSSTASSVSDAASKISSPDASKPLNPAIVATLADNAWRMAASQPGYSGLPYDVTDPITATDAQAWKDANPAYWPTVGDAVSPQPAPSGGIAATPFTLPQSTSPVSSVDPTTGTNTGTNPSTQPQVNLGADPGIGAPGLETVPTAHAILAPILNLMPSLKSFVVPGHQSICPTPSADLFGKHLVLDGHCSLLDTARPTLYAVMAFAWLALAMFIVLAA